MNACSDIPYLEDLILYLKSHEDIKECFPAIGSVKISVGPRDLEEIIKKDCPYDKALYIYPERIKRTSEKRLPCIKAEQVLGIAIVKRCTGKHFEYEKNSAGELVLSGDYMEVACLRKKVLDAMKCFNSENVTDFWWSSTFATTTADCLLISGIEYGVTFTI